MALWPTVPPAPPGAPSPTAEAVLDTIRTLAAVPDGAPAERWAEAITDLQVITATAYRAFAGTTAKVQPPHEPRGILTLSELQTVMGASKNSVIGVIRSGRRYEAGEQP